MRHALYVLHTLAAYNKIQTRARARAHKHTRTCLTVIMMQQNRCLQHTLALELYARGVVYDNAQA